MRCSAWPNVESEVRNGAKRARKVAVTARARLMKSDVLRGCESQLQNDCKLEAESERAHPSRPPSQKHLPSR